MKITPRPSRAVIVTGTPGTGKTTFAKSLARELNAKFVPLTRFVAANKLYSHFDLPRKSMVVDLGRVRTKLNALVSQTPGITIVESHIPEQIISKGLVKLVFVLRCHPRTLERRLARKRWTQDKIRENVLAELLDACLTSAVQYYGSRRIIQIETTHMSVRKCIDIAKAYLTGSSGKQVKIDWIKTLDRKRQLDKYLR